jgi:6-methylsalicylate decarboxylase
MTRPAPGKVDIHHHVRAANSAASRAGWSLEQGIEQMDRNGVGWAVTYPGAVSDLPDARGSAAAQARRINEFSAEIARAHPSRFGTYAALPMRDPDACLKEIAYAQDELGCDGFAVVTCYEDRWLGDPLFAPVFEELDRRNAVVFVHPVDSWCPGLGYESGVVTGAWLEWPTNTARTILSLMLNGVLRDRPNIRFVFCHGGGVMSVIVSRIAGFTGWFEIGPERMQELFPGGIEAQFATLYFDLAQSLAPENFEALRRLVSATHMMFGSDWDNFDIAHSVTRIDALGLDPQTYEQLCRTNALRLFGRA